IKERYKKNPFTVIAFVGPNQDQGFLVLEIDRLHFQQPIAQFFQKFGFVSFLGTIGVIILFIVMSYLFFRGIRTRLIHLQHAMSIGDTDALPVKVKVKKQDEIGKLDQVFNQRVIELKERKQRDKKRKHCVVN